MTWMNIEGRWESERGGNLLKMRKRKIGIIIRDKVRFSVYNKLTLAKKRKEKEEINMN